MRILIAEDQKELAKAIEKILHLAHFTCDIVYNGEDCLSYIQSGVYDGLVLDIMMPLKNGYEVIADLRQKRYEIPILVLSAKSEVDDKVKGLDLGANDYLSKPFHAKELVSRVKAMTRTRQMSNHILKLGNLVLKMDEFLICVGEKKERLSHKELQIMEILMAHPNHMISQTLLLDKIYSFDDEVNNGVVWTYVSYIRKKLKQLEANIEIKTLRNMGYYLEVHDD